MKLLVFRHGQTRFNAERRYLGALDPPLNSVGKAQAIAIGEAMPLELGAVISSPLQRARQTAEIMCQSRGIKVTVDQAFRERHVGVFEGLTQEEAKAAFPDLWAQNITRQWDCAPDGGETIAAVVERVTLGLTRVYENRPAQVVALVAHGFVAKVVRAVGVAGFDDFFEWQLGNAEVCELALTSNPSIERTSSSKLRLLAAAAHVKRWAPLLLPR